MHSVKHILSRQAAEHLAQRMALHQKLLYAIRQVLPPALGETCQGCWVTRRGQLVLQVAGQEYAVQVRFYQVAIAQAAQGILGTDVQKIAIRAAIPSVSSVVTATPMAPGAAKLVAEEAAASGVPEISAALGRLAVTLASRTERKSLTVDW